MKKRIIIVHQWSGSPQKDWLPWAKKVLQEKGFKVIIPTMPDKYKNYGRKWTRII